MEWRQAFKVCFNNLYHTYVYLYRTVLRNGEILPKCITLLIMKLFKKRGILTIEKNIYLSHRKEFIFKYQNGLLPPPPPPPPPKIKIRISEIAYNFMFLLLQELKNSLMLVLISGMFWCPK